MFDYEPGHTLRGDGAAIRRFLEAEEGRRAVEMPRDAERRRRLAQLEAVVALDRAKEARRRRLELDARATNEANRERFRHDMAVRYGGLHNAPPPVRGAIHGHEHGTIQYAALMASR